MTRFCLTWLHFKNVLISVDHFPEIPIISLFLIFLHLKLFDKANISLPNLFHKAWVHILGMCFINLFGNMHCVNKEVLSFESHPNFFAQKSGGISFIFYVLNLTWHLSCIFYLAFIFISPNTGFKPLFWLRVTSEKTRIKIIIKQSLSTHVSIRDVPLNSSFSFDSSKLSLAALIATRPGELGLCDGSPISLITLLAVTGDEMGDAGAETAGDWSAEDKRDSIELEHETPLRSAGSFLVKPGVLI